MKNTINEYLLEKLENDKMIKILYLSHDNCCPFYMKCKESSYDELKNNCDLIIFFSNNLFNEYEINSMRKLASYIANLNKKRVTIGYSYIIPVTERIETNISIGVFISSFYIGTEIQNIDQDNSLFSQQDLINMTIMIHDELEKTKIKQL